MNQHMRMMLVVGFLVAIAPAPFHGSAALALDAKAIGGGPSGGPVAVTPPAPTGGGTPSATPAPTPGSGVTPQQNPTTSTTPPTTQGTPATRPATGTQTPSSETDSCTDFAKLASDANKGEPGLLTDITKYIKDTVGNATRQLYEAFTKSSAYKNAVNAAITLMVVIYGVGFTIGVVQASFGQVLIRLIKVGMILTLISPTGWQFFSDYAVRFFNDGSDDIIGKVMEIGTGVNFKSGDSPFIALDGLAKVILSPDMIIAILGLLFNNDPYGLFTAGLLTFAVIGLIKMLLEGLKLYALSFVVRSLLFGVAPIFIIFLLFERTKQLFTGWLNVMVFLSLQPILYFTFISFFLVMLTTASTNMLGGNELCWTQYKGIQGSQNKVSFWRFKNKDSNFADADSKDWYGSLTCRLNGGKEKDGSPCKPSPFNIVDMLTFLILVYVAGKFAGITDNIASEISNSFVNLNRETRSDLSFRSQTEPTAAINQPRSGTQTVPRR